MKKVSVIIPCYDEEETIDLFHDTLVSSWNDNLSGHELEMVFIDDGSSDATYEKMIALAQRDSSVRYGSFSRNFGKDAAIFAGLELCSGDCAVVIDADLQQPIETIHEMVAQWDQGYEVVEGKKVSRGREAWMHRFFSGVFYSIISSIIGFDMRNSSDFKLVDRKVIDVLLSFREKDFFFRALTYWIGFRSTTVEYSVRERAAGRSKWTTGSLFRYALRNIMAFTFIPLYLIAFLGAFVMLIGIALVVDAVITYFGGTSVGGYPSLVILITLSTGAILLSIGIVSIYLSKMLNEVRDRPRYVFRDRSPKAD